VELLEDLFASWMEKNGLALMKEALKPEKKRKAAAADTCSWMSIKKSKK